MGLSRNSACLRIYNEHNRDKLSEYSIGSRASDGMKKLRVCAEVCLLWVNQWVPKYTDKTKEKSVRAELMKPLQILYAKVNRNRALKAKSCTAWLQIRMFLCTCSLDTGQRVWVRNRGAEKQNGQDQSGLSKLGWSEAVLLTSLHRGRLGGLLSPL